MLFFRRSILEAILSGPWELQGLKLEGCLMRYACFSEAPILDLGRPGSLKLEPLGARHVPERETFVDFEENR